MGSTFSRTKTWIAETLTASDLNAEFDNILNNLTPAGVDDESANAAAMQATADPYPGSVASLATSLTGEIQRIRYQLNQLVGGTYWYEDNTTYATVASHATTSAIWAGAGNVRNFTGAETITDFPAAPQAGAQRTLICAGAVVFTHGGSITVQGAATYTAAAGDVIIVTATTTTAFKINILNQASKPAILLAGTAGKTITVTENTSLDEAVAMSSKLTIPGAWTTPTFAAGDFTAIGAMTWTVEAGDVVTYAYTISGKVMTVAFELITTAIGGTPSYELRIKIPGGKTATKNMSGYLRSNNNETYAIGMSAVGAGGTNILCYATAAFGNWANPAALYGQITFEIN